MDIVRAFNFIFDDQDWVGKLVIVAMLTFAIIFFPFGLLALAALLGYALELAANVRAGHPTPLPRWDDITTKLANGMQVLLAWAVYYIPALVIIACSVTLLRGFAVILLCCLSPLILLYSLAAGTLLAVGTAQFIENGDSRAFYRFPDQVAFISANPAPMLEWLFFSVIANILIGIVGAIPCIGWIVALGVSVPVQGHLLGQLVASLADKPKRKPKPKRDTTY
jgi:hypothetical protein